MRYHFVILRSSLSIYTAPFHFLIMTNLSGIFSFPVPAVTPTTLEWCTSGLPLCYSCWPTYVKLENKPSAVIVHQKSAFKRFCESTSVCTELRIFYINWKNDALSLCHSEIKFVHLYSVISFLNYDKPFLQFSLFPLPAVVPATLEWWGQWHTTVLLLLANLRQTPEQTFCSHCSSEKCL
jgi:hypothetical protein